MTDNEFAGVMVLVLAVNETLSLRRTVCEIAEILPPEDVRKILIFYPPFATDDCVAVIHELSAQELPIPVMAEPQISENRAESLMYVFRKKTDATHVMFWSSDGEVESNKITLLLSAAKENPQACVKFSRMMKGGSQPAERNVFLKARDKAFCVLTRVLLRANITDALFFGHVIFPVAPFNSFYLTEAGASIIIEILNLFARLGDGFIEFPICARQRTDSKSNIKLKQKFKVLFFMLRLTAGNYRRNRHVKKHIGGK